MWHMDLLKHWHIQRLDPGAEFSPSIEPEGWLTADMPEQIHHTLRRAGLITGPYYGKDPHEDDWVEQSDWLYFKSFYLATDAPDDLALEFDGLDTFADIYINGRFEKSAQNMHLPLSIRAPFKHGARNTLLIHFKSARAFVKDRPTDDLYPLNKVERVLTRKAQMSYGWDFCASCAGVGIWKGVRLVDAAAPRIQNYFLRTVSLSEGRAEIALSAEALGGRMRAQLSRGDTLIWQAEFDSEITFELNHPLLWWPRPYGEPHLYDFKLELLDGDTFLDLRTQKFGIRTVEVETPPHADGGRLFAFRVNGRRLFIRGANWVPMSAVFTEITESDYRRAIARAAHANLTMLRVWGGGIYEPALFYDLCAEAGILVWSDFMLACGVFPRNGAFLDNVRAEAEHAVLSMRNHTALAMYSGDNENDQAYGWDGRDYQFLNDPISRDLLKAVCARLDPSRYYLPSSPCSPEEGMLGGDNPNSPFQGDMHLYQMSARKESLDYHRKILDFTPRFLSEFGFISLPFMESYNQFNVRGRALETPRWLQQALPQFDEVLARDGLPGAAFLSQVLHAEGLKLAIEHLRANKGVCYGSLCWKFNDPHAGTGADPRGLGPWPSLMASYDMLGHPKLAYDATRRAYADELLCAIPYRDGVRIFLVSERTADVSGELLVRQLSFDGDVLFSRRERVHASGDQSTLLMSIPSEVLRPDRQLDSYLKIELGALENWLFLCEIADWHRLDSTPCGLSAVSTRGVDGSYHLKLKTERFARFVHLSVPGADPWADDNNFHLDAGAEKTIALKIESEADPRSLALFVEAENSPRIWVAL